MIAVINQILTQLQTSLIHARSIQKLATNDARLPETEDATIIRQPPASAATARSSDP